MVKIFISYAHEDRNTALEIYNALKIKRLSPWIDAKDLLPGQEWKAEIGKAIRESDIFVACLSNYSVSKKGYVQAELKKALEVAEEMPEGEVYIIPIRLDDCKVPVNLSKWHWVDYFNEDERLKFFQAIEMRSKLSQNVPQANPFSLLIKPKFSKLSLPLENELVEESGWLQPDKYLYFIARFHLHLERMPLYEFAFGDIVRTYHTTPHSENEIVRSFEEEISTVDLKETIRSAVLANDLGQNVARLIAEAAPPPSYTLSSGIVEPLEQAIHRNTYSAGHANSTVTKHERKTFAISQRVKVNALGLQLAVTNYQKYSQSVFLHYVDYLFVEYKPRPSSRQKKKRNLPRLVGGTHSNRILFNMPLFKLLYWNLETENSLLFTEAEYRNLPKVSHLNRVAFEELNDTISLPLPVPPERPSLYALSNSAFPLLWVDRKGPWTREELEKIELEEADASATRNTE